MTPKPPTLAAKTLGRTALAVVSCLVACGGSATEIDTRPASDSTASALGGTDGGLVTRTEKTLVVLVKHADAPPVSVTPADIEATMEATSDRLKEFSYGRVALSGDKDPTKSADVLGWYTTSDPACHDASGYLSKLAAQDVSLDRYSRFVVIVAQRPSCAGTLSAVALGSRVTLSLANAGVGTLTHELGHTFLAKTAVGYGHANFLDCGSAAIATSGCKIVQYGDPYDTMAAARGHFSAAMKDALGWFAGTTALKEVTTSGTFVLEPFETDTNGIKALKVSVPNQAPLYVEYRQPLGADASLGTSVFKGALFHLGTSLINTSPPALAYTGLPTDAQLTPALRVGATLDVPGTGTFTVLSRSDAALKLRVTLAAPTLELTVNGTSDPATLDAPASVTACWKATGVGTSCTASGAWSGTWGANGCSPLMTFAEPGTHTLTMTCTNAQGSASKSVAVDVQVPTTLPTVSAGAGPLGAERITLIAPATYDVSWTSSRAALGCTNTGAWSGLTVGNDFTQTFTNVPVGTYTYGVRCSNSIGSVTDSAVVEVVPRPLVTITEPAPAAHVAGSTMIRLATATPSLLNWISLAVDGAGVGMVMPGSLELALDTTQLADGPHTLTTMIQDADRNLYEGPSSTFTVANVDREAPTIVLAPLASTVRRTVTLKATASDDVELAGVQFLVDGMNVGAEVNVPPYRVKWNTTALPDGPHSVSARARDAVGRTTTSAPRTVTTDNTAPVITSVSATAGSSGATITWTTNEAASTQVEYGLTSSLGSRTTRVSKLTIAHSQSLADLTPSTTYYYRVLSRDAALNSTASSIRQFTTGP